MTTSRISASVPVDAVARRVTSKGIHWTADWNFKSEVITDLPLPIFPRPENAEDFAGQKFGRLTVIGYGGTTSSGSRWVVRCSCGNYGHKRSKTLRKSDVPRLMCGPCDKLEQIKIGLHFDRWRKS